MEAEVLEGLHRLTLAGTREAGHDDDATNAYPPFPSARTSIAARLGPSPGSIPWRKSSASPLETELTELGRIGTGIGSADRSNLRGPDELRDPLTDLIGKADVIADFERPLSEERLELLKEHIERDAISGAHLLDGLRLRDRAVRASSEMKTLGEDAARPGMDVEGLVDGLVFRKMLAHIVSTPMRGVSAKAHKRGNALEVAEGRERL